MLTDPETGNVRAAMTTVSVDCYLKAISTNTVLFPGVDSEETIYEGYTLDPQALPSGVGVGTRGTLVFAGEDAVDCEVMELRMPYGKTGLLGGTLTAVVGEQLKLVARKQI